MVSKLRPASSFRAEVTEGRDVSLALRCLNWCRGASLAIPGGQAHCPIRRRPRPRGPIAAVLPRLDAALAALDVDVEAKEQKRPKQDGCDHRQDLPNRREGVEVIVNRRDHDPDNDPDDGD
jgi:hypothetical protein